MGLLSKAYIDEVDDINEIESKTVHKDKEANQQREKKWNTESKNQSKT